MEEKKKLIAAGKYGLYMLVILLLYVLQTTPGFLQVFGVKPFLVIPMVICIAMYEGEFVGALLGAFGGLLCDMAASTFFGFYTVSLFLFCTGTGLCIIYLMKNDVKGAVLLCGGYVLAMGLIEFTFYYMLWGYDGWEQILFYRTLPRTLYTCLILPLCYRLTERIWQRFQQYIEQL